MKNIFRIVSKGLTLGAVGLLLPAAALSQLSFNIDIDDEFAPPEGGKGVPSSSFGAALGDSGKGYWNKLKDTGEPPLKLRNLAGDLTNVTVTSTQGGIGGSNNFPGQDDNRRLMNDGVFTTSLRFWTFDNVYPGVFSVTTYSVIPRFDNSYNPTPVTVGDGGTKYVNGPMLVDQFVEGQTHVTHLIHVDTGAFSIRVDRGQLFAGFVNGFQIREIVPEPTTALGLTAGFLSLALRGRRRRS